MASEKELREIAERQARAWESGDADRVAADFALDCEFVVPRVRLRGSRQVREAARKYFADYSGTRIRIERVIASGDSAAVEWTWKDKHRSTGEESCAEDVIIFRVREGKIIYWREYIDSVSCVAAAVAERGGQP